MKNPMVCYRDRIQEYQTKNSHGLNVHDSLKSFSVETLKKIQSQDFKPLEVALLNIEGDLNISVMIRSACLMGARKVYVIGRRKYDQRGTVGAVNYVPVEKIECLNSSRTNFDFLKITNFFEEKEVFPIFVEQGGILLGNEKSSAFLSNIIKMSGKTPLVIMGNESTGIPLELISQTQKKIPNSIVVSIPQCGVLRSFNVSSAFAIAFWEINKILGYI